MNKQVWMNVLSMVISISFVVGAMLVLKQSFQFSSTNLPSATAAQPSLSPTAAQPTQTPAQQDTQQDGRSATQTQIMTEHCQLLSKVVVDIERALESETSISRLAHLREERRRMQDKLFVYRCT